MTVTTNNVSNQGTDLDSDDGNCVDTTGTLDLEIDNFSIGSDIGSQVRVLMDVQAGFGGTSNETDFTVSLSVDNGSTHCSGHSVNAVADGACSGAASVSRTVVCTHAAGVPDTDAEADAAEIEVVYVGGDATKLNRVRYELTHAPLGYGNEVMGVASGNIGEISGIATANIAEVSGVA